MDSVPAGHRRGRLPWAKGLDPDRDEILPLVAAMAGYFAERGTLPDPPGLPTVRAFQRAQGQVTTAWLRRLWES